MPAADPEPPPLAPRPLAGVAAPELELLLETDVDAFADDESGGAGAPFTCRPPGHAFLLDWARLALAATCDGGAPAVRTELSMRLVSAATMRELNRDWRDRDAPTNVLSFPSGLPVLAADDDGQGALLVLGDIALCPAVVATEARAQGKRVDDHWAHLVVHGVLHLRGLDHEDEEGARSMETLESRLLTLRGLPDPYATHTDTGAITP